VETFQHIAGFLCLLILTIQFGKGIWELFKDGSLAGDSNYINVMAIMGGIAYLVAVSLPVK